MRLLGKKSWNNPTHNTSNYLKDKFSEESKRPLHKKLQNINEKNLKNFPSGVFA